MPLLRTVSELQQDIGKKNHHFTHSTCIMMALLG